MQCAIYFSGMIIGIYYCPKSVIKTQSFPLGWQSGPSLKLLALRPLNPKFVATELP